MVETRLQPSNALSAKSAMISWPLDMGAAPNWRDGAASASQPIKVGSLLALLLSSGCKQGVLDPHGPIAAAERLLLFNSIAIMLTVVVPVIVATLVVSWWFRASNKRATYRPTWAYSGKVEIVIWSIPVMIIMLLGGIAWISSHELDPPRPIKSDRTALEVQVVSLDWKWLFIYPEQGVASVNRLVVPAGRPVSLKLTSATVMNSFIVPQLAGQIYTMNGMATQLNLVADHTGQFPGLSAQFSGDGFSGMRFMLEAVTDGQFDTWVTKARAGGGLLDAAAYGALARPSQYVVPTTYSAVMPGLFDRIVDPQAATAPLPHPSPSPSPVSGTSSKGH